MTHKKEYAIIPILKVMQDFVHQQLHVFLVLPSGLWLNVSMLNWDCVLLQKPCQERPRLSTPNLGSLTHS